MGGGEEDGHAGEEGEEEVLGVQVPQLLPDLLGPLSEGRREHVPAGKVSQNYLS